MSQKSISQADLKQFTGTEHWYRHTIVRKVLYTDGVQYVAENGGAYWLVDEIAFAQSIPVVAAEEFQFWKLTVDLVQHTGFLVCEDGNNHVVSRKAIAYTDFPLEEISFYFTNNTLLLPSEY